MTTNNGAEAPPPGRVVCVGLSSRTTDGYHALFWDLDYPEGATEATTLAAAKRGLRHALHDYRLPEIHIMDAGQPNSWHAISPVRAPIDKAEEILKAHPDHDPGHVQMGRELGRWILRITPKEGDTPVSHVATLRGNEAAAFHLEGWEYSTAHRRLVHHPGLYDGPRDNLDTLYTGRGDGHTKYVLEHYATTKTREADPE